MDVMYIVIILVLSVIVFALSLVVSKLSKKSNYDGLKKDLSFEFKQTREEISNAVGSKIVESTNVQQGAITNLTQINETKLENIRKTVEERLDKMQKDNNDKLDRMRMTVDEKLQSTLENRLTESFKLVNERLESVYKGLGEMQTLAQGVGDLKKVFTNVKSRGYWGEIELSNILEQFLTPEQYLTNVKIKSNSNDFVEFAIKFPGKNTTGEVLLPVDSKFPIEDYSKLIEAEENGDVSAITEFRKNLENEIKLCAKAIYDKYISPPKTTDFGIMFLPTESLYCEIIKNTALCEILSQKYRVLVTGPTTFVALLNSLQMGFRTLAIEKRSSEVWELLGTIKTEFGKFGDLLDKTNKKLAEISNTMTLASQKTKTIQSKLKKVEALPVAEQDDIVVINSSLESESENTNDNTDENE